MTLARRQQISLDHTPYYHCTSRCVRRAFLCGRDRYSGQNFEHRREWIENRLKQLSKIFALDILAYAIMSNHYHVVVRLDPDAARAWGGDEVLERWAQLYAIKNKTTGQLETYRRRLASLSWFMRAVNEPIARRANCEDGCKGRFWEGRFKSQALLDEAALVKCMAYVDLNPLRAGIAKMPETSLHTSVYARIMQNDQHLLGFAVETAAGDAKIPIRERDYLSLIDWTGRAIRPDKRGAIPPAEPDILKRLGFDDRVWLREMRHFGHWYYRAVGSAQALQAYCAYLGQQWLKGIGYVQSCAA